MIVRTSKPKQDRTNPKSYNYCICSDLTALQFHTATRLSCELNGQISSDAMSGQYVHTRGAGGVEGGEFDVRWPSKSANTLRPWMQV